MMRKLINTSLRLRVLVTVVAAGILIAGVTQLRDARVDLHPEFTPTIVEVQTEALGLSAQEVEQLITSPTEADLLNGVAWVDRHPLGVGPRPVVDRHDLRAGHAALPGPAGGPGAHGPGVRPPRRVEAAADAPAGVVDQPDHDDRPLVEDAVADRHLPARPLDHQAPADGRAGRRQRVDLRPAGAPAPGPGRPQGPARQGRRPPRRGRGHRERPVGVAAQLPRGVHPGTGGFIETPCPASRYPARLPDRERRGPRPGRPAAQGRRGSRPAPPRCRLGDVAKVVEDHQPLIGDATLDSGPGIVHGGREAPRRQHRRRDQGRRGGAGIAAGRA